MQIGYKIRRILKNNRAQILLPSVMLAPIFILVMYLLFELTKVSIAKIRNQYALDNAAYTQVTAVSTQLNGIAMTNGPLPYRTLRTYNAEIPVKEGMEEIAQEKFGKTTTTIFDLFFRAGAVPTIADDYEWGINSPPSADATDWGVHFAYYEGIDADAKNEEEGKAKGYKYDRRAMGWELPQPKAPDEKEELALMHKEMVRYFKVDTDTAVAAIYAYLFVYAQVGSIYESQTYAAKETTRNAQAFREGYYLNVDDCKPSECARQSAKKLAPFLRINTKRFDIKKATFFASYDRGGTSGSVTPIELNMQELLNGNDLFLFAYIDPSSTGNLRTLSRGIRLKQSYHLPSNYFNIHLEQKYKPYVRNTVVMSCGRPNNNCIWPNPLPKYNVYLRP